MIQNHVESVPEAAWDLHDAADRPTTIVLPGGRGVDSSILGPGGSLAVRRINEPWCEFVIRGLENLLLAQAQTKWSTHTQIL